MELVMAYMRDNFDLEIHFGTASEFLDSLTTQP